MRILAWLGAWSVLTVGCRLIVPLEGLSGVEPSTSDGGASGRGGGGSSGTAGGNVDGGDARLDRDAASEESSVDASPDGPGNVPIVAIQGSQPITGITVNATHLYWVEGGNVYRAPKSSEGGAAEGIDNSRSDFDVAVDSDYVYWTENAMTVPPSGLVWRKPISDPSAMRVDHYAPGAQTARYIAAGDMHQVFISDPSAINSSDRFPIPSGAIYLGQIEASGVTLFNGELYWGHGGPRGIKNGAVDGLRPAAEILFRDLQGVVSGVATDGDHVYWIEDAHLIRRTPLRVMRGSISEVCSESTEDADAGFGPDSDVAVDDQWVYFSEPSLMRISKCRKP
jgi:hypothetical protein